MEKRFTCKICGLKYERRAHFRRHHNLKHKDEIFVNEFECTFCKIKDFDNHFSFAAHVTNCKLNPNYESKIKKLSLRQKGTKLSEERKKKISDSVNNRIKKDEWHNSFRKSSKLKHNGEIFDGRWEILIAEMLSENEIKWERNKKRFEYFFEGKNRSYLPDFYLPDFDTYIEVKGYATKKDESKWNQFPKILKVISGRFINSLFPEIVFRDNWKISVQNKLVEVL